MNVAIIADHDNQCLNLSTLHAITAAQCFEGKCCLVLLGTGLDSIINEAQKIRGITSILALEHPRLKNAVAEDLVECLLSIASEFNVFIAPANTFGKNIMPRFAAKIDVNAYSDVIKITSFDTFVRPVYAGNVLQTVRALDVKKVLTIRPTAFNAAMIDDTLSLEVQRVSVTLSAPLTQFCSAKKSQSKRPNLATASVVVSGGRGLKSAEKFKLVDELADKLGAAVGASRAAVDAGFVTNDLQVGQTGQIVAPELYISLGISGAIQHLAGMKDSKVIVAINKDPDAPIFKIATYGLVGDVFELVPELINKI